MIDKETKAGEWIEPHLQPAFPAMHFDLAPDEHGITMRDYFAAKAMTGLLTAEIVGEYSNDHVAEISYRIADAMLKARNENN